MTHQPHLLKSKQILFLLLSNLLLSTCHLCSKLPSLLTCHFYSEALSLLLSLTLSILRSFMSTNQAAKHAHQLVLLTNVFLHLVVERKS